MPIQLSETYGWIVEELARRRPLAEAMKYLVDRCEGAQPHRDWARLRGIPYDDLPQLRSWIERVFREEPAKRPLSGLWFGLFNPSRDGESLADLYVSGSERFYPVPGDNSWAVGPDWWPEGRYADSPVLAELYRIAYNESGAPNEDEPPLANDAEYPLCLGYAAFAVQELLSVIEPAALLRGSQSLGIATGFDSGDFILLGEVTAEGIRPVKPIPAAPELPVEIVREKLRSPDEKVVWRGLLELDRLGSRVQEIVHDLLHLAHASPQFGLRAMAISQVVLYSPSDPNVKAAVLRAFEDRDASVRQGALQAIIAIENLTPDDLSRIQCMEDDPDEEVAWWSEIALRNIQSKSEKGESVPEEPEPGDQ